MKEEAKEGERAEESVEEKEGEWAKQEQLSKKSRRLMSHQRRCNILNFEDSFFVLN